MAFTPAATAHGLISLSHLPSEPHFRLEATFRDRQKGPREGPLQSQNSLSAVTAFDR
jgi:hypothetical protein